MIDQKLIDCKRAEVIHDHEKMAEYQEKCLKSIERGEYDTEAAYNMLSMARFIEAGTRQLARWQKENECLNQN